MAKPTIKIVNLETGEELEREMNDQEYENYTAQKNDLKNEVKSISAKEAARQSALEKLAALGLTEAEIQALAG